MRLAGRRRTTEGVDGAEAGAGGAEDALAAKEDTLRENLFVYTRQAFRVIPPIFRPRVLDLGCGSGIPTVGLATMGGGNVAGVDTSEPALARARRRAEAQGVADRVTVVNRSILAPGFPEEKFDIVWAEGVMQFIGFGRALSEWRRLVKPGGYLVIHDAAGDEAERAQDISVHRYRLVESFTIPGATWWNDYFAPLKVFLEELRAAAGGDAGLAARVERKMGEVRAAEADPEGLTSVFVVMQAA